MLSQLPDEVTERSERIGRNLAVALQAFIELQPFIEENHFDSDLSLGSAPVLFHLQNDSKLLEYIGTCEGDIDNLDLKKVTFSLPPDPQGTIQVLHNGRNDCYTRQFLALVARSQSWKINNLSN